MKILALEKEIPGIADDQFTPDILRKETERAWELYQSGIIRELYFRADREEAVLMLECKNSNEAQSVLATLPLVQAGLIGFDVIPLSAYPGFARLFTKNK
jgi:muconolactone delta-isomerase